MRIRCMCSCLHTGVLSSCSARNCLLTGCCLLLPASLSPPGPCCDNLESMTHGAAAWHSSCMVHRSHALLDHKHTAVSCSILALQTVLWTEVIVWLSAAGCGACVAHLQHAHHCMQHVQPAEGSYGSAPAHAERRIYTQCYHLQCSHFCLWQGWPTGQSHGGMHAVLPCQAIVYCLKLCMIEVVEFLHMCRY